MQKILIVEDNAELQRLFIKVLDRAGYRVDGALYLDDAQRLVSTESYCLILCDIQMGDGDSLTFLAEWVETWHQRGTAVVAMSGESKYRHRCEELGIDFYLEKPVSTVHLAELVRRLAPQTCV